jgi:hypothetical protein
MTPVPTEAGYDFITPNGKFSWNRRQNYIYYLFSDFTSANKDVRKYVDESIKMMFEQTDCLILRCEVKQNNTKAKLIMNWFVEPRTEIEKKDDPMYVRYQLTLGLWARKHGLDPLEVIAKKPK